MHRVLGIRKPLPTLEKSGYTIEWQFQNTIIMWSQQVKETAHNKSLNSFRNICFYLSKWIILQNNCVYLLTYWQALGLMITSLEYNGLWSLNICVILFIGAFIRDMLLHNHGDNKVTFYCNLNKHITLWYRNKTDIFLLSLGRQIKWHIRYCSMVFIEKEFFRSVLAKWVTFITYILCMCWDQNSTVSEVITKVCNKFVIWKFINAWLLFFSLHRVLRLWFTCYNIIQYARVVCSNHSFLLQ